LLDEVNTDVHRNLAVEEALARVCAAAPTKTNTMRFWKSSRAVVMGRFQCVHKEVNLSYCRDNDIAIARRFTGGGAVFHDGGNLNITFCLDQKNSSVARTLYEVYWNFFGAIAEALRQLGVHARYEPVRASVRVGSKKISGTAGWMKQGVTFIHGTLLINSDLDMLRFALQPQPGQQEYIREDGRVRCKDSRRDTVTSVIQELDPCPRERVIKAAIVQSIEDLCGCKFSTGELTQEEIDSAESLYSTRYSRDEWNLGIVAQ
jgi:lipoate-protein ligase A